MLLGRQPRLVKVDGTISVRERDFGPLPDDLIGMPDQHFSKRRGTNAPRGSVKKAHADEAFDLADSP